MTNKTNNHKDSGSFLTGFSVGLFAGAAAFFLFATDQGKEMKSDLAKEWEKAKDTMVDKGVIEHKNVGIRDVLKSIFSKVNSGKTSLAKSVTKAAKKVSSSKKNSRSTTTKRVKPAGSKKSQKFKGV